MGGRVGEGVVVVVETSRNDLFFSLGGGQCEYMGSSLGQPLCHQDREMGLGLPDVRLWNADDVQLRRKKTHHWSH